MAVLPLMTDERAIVTLDADNPVTARILCTDLAGLRNQALGLAEAAGFATDNRVIVPKAPWNYLSPMLWPRATCAVEAGALAGPDGDLMIGAGGAAARLVAALRRPDLPAVIIQHPRMDADRFDAIIAAPHDAITGPNVIVARTAMHRVTPARLAEARAQWAPVFAHLPRPLVAVLIGGSNGRYRLDTAAARQIADGLAGMMDADRASVMLTPSRRTDAAARAMFHETLAPRGAWVWDMAGDNPYFGMLALADAIVVTADSVSMVSEAVATSAPVMLARLPGKSTRIGAFMDDMVACGRARDFAGRLDLWPVTPLDDTPMAAGELRRRLGI
ncbi:mitochondrial fission ELM1 family protein [Acidiphilium sp. PA]|uniref:mitochondrial fission ELM1 family protein n=1 Tax=Acidiphilium sp. PA TaxID=2871705 RepID=UPI002242DBB3|nr:mitochondrial fission ELM1 family protein [Acidiphilium sp. PA]MCW8307480.1 mitochondrial fission ELM1 family protein [Acidiphilium sp. PA]